MDYRAPVERMLFAMRHGAGAARLPHWDDAIAAQVLTEAARFIEAEIAPLDPVADATPARLVDGRVEVAPQFVEAYRRFCAAGWPGLAAPESYGGQGLPHVLAAAVSEMLSGACVTFQMILSLAQGAIRTLNAHGSEEQKARYLPRLASGEWLATMCLTEPQAGSDLGLVRTVAEPVADGSYRIHGGKIFISAGDQNMSENVLHLVLARTPGAPAGVKGLSLFFCPAVLPDGTRNRLSCVRLEEKMGMHGSPTCQMSFEGAHAEIVGHPGEGLALMFMMMNAERLDVGIQGAGLAEVAGQRSRGYAAERLQGRAQDDNGPVAINRHDDVRRMLLTQFALTEACRALLYRTDVELGLGHNPALVDFLTPVCKAFATDAGVESAHLAIQVHGGYGYLKEYRVEQILRDARITQIYEGTNGIQAMTLCDRMLRIAGGAPARAFVHETNDAISIATPAFAKDLGQALQHWERATGAILERQSGGAVAAVYLRLTGLIAAGAALSRLEAAADSAADPARVRAVGAFYRSGLLPECEHLARLVESGPDLAAVTPEVFDAN